MKVGILGSGDVAKALAGGFLKHGHQVMLGTRDTGKLKDFVGQNKAAQTGSFADAAKFGELVVLAVKGTGALDALKAAGAANMAGKPVIDATNPIADAPPANGVLKFFTNLDQSLMERLQAALPEVHFVKAFNSVGNAAMINPKFPGGKPTMFICGNDDKRQSDCARHLRSVRLGDRRYGQGRSRPRDRAVVHAVVHSGLYPQRLVPRFQAAAAGVKRRGARA